jgi:hypothetical protein
MTRTVLTLALAAQLAAGAVFAQTTETITDTIDEMAPSSFGADWSTALRGALISEDGVTIRTAADLSAQWQTLSEEDRNILIRDCMMFMQQPAPAADPTAGMDTGTSGDVADAPTADVSEGTEVNVTTAQMEEICAATKDF